MTFASRITDLVTAIATAMNARAQKVGASSYDLAVMNGYTGTQNQYLATLQADSRAAALARALATDLFGPTVGAAWPAQWTLRGTNGTGTAVGVTGSYTGVITPKTGTYNGARASLESIGSFGECGIVATVGFDVSTSAFAALFINGSGTGSGTYSSYIAPDYSYSVELDGGGNLVLYETNGQGSGTNIASASFTFITGLEYRVRLERVGRTLRAKAWLSSAPEPETWNVAGTVSASTPLTGYPGVGGQNGSFDNQSFHFREIAVYILAENQATTSVPGIVQFATQTEVITATESAKAISPAALLAIAPNVATTDPLVTSDAASGFPAGRQWYNSVTKVLFESIDSTTGNAVWRRLTADIQVWSASAGAWTKPPWAQQVDVVVIGGGGGGGSGRRGPSATAQGGGAGGGGGGLSSSTFQASLLPATVGVGGGTGGNGGASQGTDTTSGAAGSAGTPSTFGTFLRATNGTGGAAGSTATATAGAAGAGENLGVAGGAGGFGVTGTAGVANWSGGVGGGGGGGVSATPTATSGGAGGIANHMNIAGATGGGAGVSGAAGTSSVSMPGAGGGGGGGGVTAAGGSGGAGGAYGAGGGGGGASLNGFASGAGGRGGDGLVLVITT